MDKKTLCAEVVSRLKVRYPDGVCSLESNNPLQLLIATRLSAQCTDARVNIVTPALFAAYPTLDALCEAEIEDIENKIKTCGLFHTKAKDIKNMCLAIKERFGGVVPDNTADLLTLPGVGRKTANLIMGDVYGAPAVVADTHCIRISNRLGLVDSTDPYKVEVQLLAIADHAESNNLCHRFVLFGREICSARAPKCSECPLGDICPSCGE